MTDISTEPVVAPSATPDAPPDPAPAPAPVSEPETASDLNHTPGGYPVLPLALSGANTTASVIGAGALVGGPVGAAAAACVSSGGTLVPRRNAPPTCGR